RKFLELRCILDVIDNTNKRPLENEEIQIFSSNANIICSFCMTTAQISAEVGEELAMEIASVRDNNPVVWTSTLEKYIDNALQVRISLEFLLAYTIPTIASATDDFS
ncbi:hypothetical protein BC938DRAFT_480843, partial [Jimgerdemannia flammicorona]